MSIRRRKGAAVECGGAPLLSSFSGDGVGTALNDTLRNALFIPPRVRSTDGQPA